MIDFKYSDDSKNIFTKQFDKSNLTNYFQKYNNSENQTLTITQEELEVDY